MTAIQGKIRPANGIGIVYILSRYTAYISYGQNVIYYDRVQRHKYDTSRKVYLGPKGRPAIVATCKITVFNWH